jgi:glycosyltransferase involved in cell wall biosynthesis
MHPKRSVVLCAYGDAPYLAEQLASIAEQSQPIDELLVGDDGSPSLSSPEVQQQLQRLSARVFVNAPRLGAAQNFSRGLERAQGNIVFLSDQDDVWHPNKVRVIEAAFRAVPSTLLVATDAQFIDASGNPDGRSLGSTLGLDRQTRLQTSDWLYALLRRNRITGATCAVSRRLLDLALPVPPNFWHDEWLALVAAACEGLIWMPDRLMRYRIHDGNAAGLRGIGPKAVVAAAIAGGTAHHAAKAAKAAVLAEHLRSLGEVVVPARRRQVEAAVTFWRERATLPASLPRRMAFVVDTLRSRGYSNFADGLKSAMRDLTGI